MKNPCILILAMLLASLSVPAFSQSTTSSCTGKRIVVTPWADGGKYYSGKPGNSNFLDVKPGDTLVLRSSFNTWSYFSLEDVHGTPSCPIVVINEGGQVSMTKGIDVRHCSDIKITGTGSTDYYGFQVYNPADNDNAGVAIGIQGRSKNIEVERIYVHKKTYGAWIKQEPGCIDSLNYPAWRMTNIKFHDSKFFNIGQDCIYAGSTDPTGSRNIYCNNVETHPIPMRLGNIQIYNLTIDSCMRTGIQLSGCDSGYNAIYNNVITRTGFELNQQQGTGISIGGMTKNCHVYNNTITQTFLYGILGLGCGTNYIENNKIDSTGYLGTVFNSYSQPSNIYTDTRPGVPFDSAKYVISGNTFGLTASSSLDNIYMEKSYDVYAAGTNICSNTLKATGSSAVLYVRPGIDWYNCGVSSMYKSIPAKVEAEDWAAMSGVQTEATADAGGGVNVGWIDNGDWMDYKLSAGSAGTYTLKFRVAATADGGQFQLRKSDGTVLTTITVPNTGGWQAWTTVNATVSLSAGSQTLRIISTAYPNWNINWVDYSLNSVANIAPVVNAGADTTITLPSNSVVLTGTATDADGTIASYQWSKVSGPAQGTIATPAAAGTTVSGLVQGVYLFELQATDNSGAVAKDTVQVTVQLAPNKAPAANAGTDITITLPVNSVQLNGSGTDTDGTITTYQWTKVSGPASFTIGSAQAAQTTVSGLVQGIYTFLLQVTDNSGATAADTVSVTVNPAPNIAPVAKAGPDQVITLPVNSVQLLGSGVDSDGTIVSYQWVKVSGPSSYVILNPSQAQTTVSGLVQGTYQFELAVIDNSGATAKDTLNVVVNAALNLAPTVNAGADKSITLPTNSVALSATAADTDGTIASYAWRQISGPAASTIGTPSQASTTISNLVQGVYGFEVNVVDNAGAEARDTVAVTVNAAPNVAPVANAGADKTITLPTNSVTLGGSGADSDGTIASYTWTKISGPSQFSIASPAAATTNITNLVQGAYLFELAVTDNAGAVGKDTVAVNVLQAPANQKPVANAGPDQTISTTSTTLSGTATDADGTVVSYQWTTISGPGKCTIVSPTQPKTTVTNLGKGTYQFELKVTDNLGAIGRDTVVVSVKINGKVAAASAKVFPTVTSDNINIALDGEVDHTPTNIAIYNISGALVYKEAFVRNSQQATRQINVAGFVTGTYVVTIDTATGSVSQKFIKQ